MLLGSFIWTDPLAKVFLKSVLGLVFQSLREQNEELCLQYLFPKATKKEPCISHKTTEFLQLDVATVSSNSYASAPFQWQVSGSKQNKTKDEHSCGQLHFRSTGCTHTVSLTCNLHRKLSKLGNMRRPGHRLRCYRFETHPLP